MTGTLRFVASPRIGRICLADVALQAGNAERLDVLVLLPDGTTQRIPVGYTEKWGATSWRKELQCFCCLGAARVLEVVNGMALCRRCFPVSTACQRHKNATAWETEGAFVDALIRTVLRPKATRNSRQRLRRLASRLRKNAAVRMTHELSKAQHLLVTVDNLDGGSDDHQ